MADDHTQRPYRAPDSAGRPSGSDPLAELARLIGQSDPFAEFGRGNAQRPAAPPVQPAPAAHATAEDAWSVPPGPVPGYAPQAPQAPTHPAAQAYQAPPAGDHYADADLYNTQGGEAAYAEHAPAEGYEQPYDPNYDYAGHPPYGPEEDDYYEDVQPRRRMGILAIAAVFALAVIGTAGAFGYRALFGTTSSGPPPIIKASTAPSKVVPPKKDAKLIQERMPAGEKLVSREERPVDIQNKPVGVFPQGEGNAAAPGTVTPMIGTGVIGGQPKKIHTIVIRPDQPGDASAATAAPPARSAPSAPITAIKHAPPPAPSAPPARSARSTPPAQPVHHAAPATHHAVARAAPEPRHRVASGRPTGNAPLSLSPDAAPPAAPMRTAALPRRAAPPPATHNGGGYAVQVSSRHSQADAEAAFRSLQSKYPSQLGGRHALIRKVDLGSKGVYYRAMVGPFGNAAEASKLCSSLKAAGGHCFVQRI